MNIDITQSKNLCFKGTSQLSIVALPLPYPR